MTQYTSTNNKISHFSLKYLTFQKTCSGPVSLGEHDNHYVIWGYNHTETQGFLTN